MAVIGSQHAFLKIEQGSQAHTDLVDALFLLTGGADNRRQSILREDGCRWYYLAPAGPATIEWRFAHSAGDVLGGVTYEVDRDEARARLKVAMVCLVYAPETNGNKPACRTHAHGVTLEEVLHNAEFYIRVKTAHYPCWQRPR